MIIYEIVKIQKANLIWNIIHNGDKYNLRCPGKHIHRPKYIYPLFIRKHIAHYAVHFFLRCLEAIYSVCQFFE